MTEPECVDAVSEVYNKTKEKRSVAMRRISLKQQILCRTAMDPDTAPANPEEPPADGDTTIQHLPEDCLVQMSTNLRERPF